MELKGLRKLLKEKLKLGKLATFVPNKCEPVYNWLYFKEGFSKRLVDKSLDKFHAKPGHWILDPFCGVGTTLLACKERGINSLGFDTLPCAIYAAKVKIVDWKTERLRKIAKNLLKKKFKEYSIKKFPSIVKRAFSKAALKDIAFFKNEIAELGESTDFFLLALINAALDCSWTRKNGAVLRIEKKHVPPIRYAFKKRIKKMFKDLKLLKKKECTALAKKADARKLPVEDESIDAVITSPPYFNQIDYLKVYQIENWLCGEKPKPPIRSFIGQQANPVDEKLRKELPGLPKQTLPYFRDLKQSLNELWRVCRSRAMIALVVGNGVAKSQLVESDLILTKLAKSIGFQPKSILVLNKEPARDKRNVKIGSLRESLLWLQKP